MSDYLATVLIQSFERILISAYAFCTILVGARLLRIGGVLEPTDVIAELNREGEQGNAPQRWFGSLKLMRAAPGTIFSLFGIVLLCISSCTMLSVKQTIRQPDGTMTEIEAKSQRPTLMSGDSHWPESFRGHLKELSEQLQAQPLNRDALTAAARQVAITDWNSWLEIESSVFEYAIEQKDQQKRATVLNDWYNVREKLRQYLGAPSGKLAPVESPEFRNAFVDFTKKYPKIFESKKSN